MQLKEINRSKIAVERKKRLERQKGKPQENTIKDEDSDINKIKDSNKKKTVKKNVVKKAEKGNNKRKTVKKNVVKKAEKDKQKIIEDNVDDNVQGKIDKSDHIEEESNVTITKEERAERFKRLHAIAQDMIKKWNK
jgi:hypothetical protein